MDFYDTWELWGPAGVGLDTPTRRLQHIERVFRRQESIGAPHLAPTLALDSPDSDAATHALAAAELASGMSENSWQSLVATKTFLRSGYRLDEYVGQLAALGSPTWVITVANEVVLGQAPDVGDTEAFAGLLRSIHSLSERSRVIVAKSDFVGLLGVAAGADTVGGGWDRSMRTYDPNAFHVASDDGIRIPASYVTQSGLLAVLRRDTAEAIERLDSALASAIRGGAMPPSDRAEREHHLRTIREVVLAMNQSESRGDRVEVLRNLYATADNYFVDLLARVPAFVKNSDKVAWHDQQQAILREYASAEGLWV
ncbi:hypothetical protein D9V29_14035 [Mycetocola manganoxydans]|uniref:Uncharacterized protein n=1 Tax=Mycetocola manganoxydans TaxID=699879 RepID=A0A3L6ZLE7_9MICO|nr:hypothetical protein D9V29_14035 [Mycetocola manganoxydans]